MRLQPDPDAAGWFASLAGRAVLSAEGAVCARRLSEAFGHVGLVLRPEGVSANFLSETQVVSGFALDVAERHGVNRPLVSALDALPFGDEAIRLLILHHVHELVPDPGALLDEVIRILVPGGKLVLVSLNPMGRSLRWKPPPPWIRHWRSASALRRKLGQMGLAEASLDGVFSRDDGLCGAASRRADGLLAPLARMAADGFVLIVRKPDEQGRIRNARSLLAESNKRVSNAAPSAGMRPANADR